MRHPAANPGGSIEQQDNSPEQSSTGFHSARRFCRLTTSSTAAAALSNLNAPEQVRPPPSAAAPGYSSWPRRDGPTLSRVQRGHGLRRPQRGPISTRSVPRRHARQGSGRRPASRVPRPRRPRCDSIPAKGVRDEWHFLKPQRFASKAARASARGWVRSGYCFGRRFGNATLTAPPHVRAVNHD
jgi:hypothetical protein